MRKLDSVCYALCYLSKLIDLFSAACTEACSHDDAAIGASLGIMNKLNYNRHRLYIYIYIEYIIYDYNKFAELFASIKNASITSGLHMQAQH